MIPVAGRAAAINAAFTEASQASGGPGHGTSPCILVGANGGCSVWSGQAAEAAAAIAVARRHPRPWPATCPGVELGTG